MARPLVSTPLRWDEVERVAGAPARTAEAALGFGPAEALARLGLEGDLFAPVLTLAQRLPPVTALCG